MYMLSTVLAATATPLIPKDPIVQRAASWQQVTFYNNSGAVMYIGDSRVSPALGIPLQPRGSYTASTPHGYTESLNDWYVFGTVGQTLLSIVIP